MKKRIENSEQLFKEKIQGHEFDFDPSAWADMERLLGQPQAVSEVPKGSSWNLLRIMRTGGFFAGLLVLFLCVQGRNDSPVTENSDTITDIQQQGKTLGNIPKETTCDKQDLGHSKLISTNTNALSTTIVKQTQTTDKQRFAKKYSEGDAALTNPTADQISLGASAKTVNRAIEGRFNTEEIQKLLGLKSVHSTFESVEDFDGFTVPEDAVQAPLQGDKSQNETAPKTSPEKTNSILLPKIESWRNKQSKRELKLKAPQAAIINRNQQRIQVGFVAGGQAVSLERSRKDTRLQPLAGLSVVTPIGQRFSAQVDLLWKRLDGYHFYASFADSGYVNNGKLAYWEYSVASERIHFFEIPVALKYSTAHQKQHFLAGMRFAQVRPEYIRTYNVFNVTRAIEDLNIEQTGGFRRWDAAMFIGADVRLWKNLWLDIRYNRGLFDLTKDQFFKNLRTDISSDAQITLKYYPFSLPSLRRAK